MSAIISDCLQYRYRLERDISQNGPVYAFLGINPSTADMITDDATVRKWRGFVSRWGGSKFIVGNVFAFRSTDVRELSKCSDPVGSLNSEYLLQIFKDADILVPCWGNTGKVGRHLRHHFDDTLLAIRSLGKPVRCFGTSKSGDPYHPLMLSYETPLRCFRN